MKLTYACAACERAFEFEAKSAPKSAPCPSCGAARTKKTSALRGSTGTYRFSRELGAVVRVSDRVPGLKKGKSGPERAPGPSCPPQGCGGCR